MAVLIAAIAIMACRASGLSKYKNVSGSGSSDSNGEVAFEDSSSGNVLTVSIMDESGREPLPRMHVWFLSNGVDVLVIVSDPNNRYAAVSREFSYEELSIERGNVKNASQAKPTAFGVVVLLAKLVDIYQNLENLSAFIGDLPDLEKWDAEAAQICINPEQAAKGLELLSGLVIDLIPVPGSQDVVKALDIVVGESLQERASSFLDAYAQDAPPSVMRFTVYTFEDDNFPQLLVLDGFCLETLDRFNAQSAVNWINYGIAHRADYPFRILINSNYVEYAGPSEQEPRITQQFIADLDSRLEDSIVVCDGVFAARSDAIEIWTSQWSPPWSFLKTGENSEKVGFVLTQDHGEWKLTSVYVGDPDTYYRVNYELLPCDAVAQLDLISDGPSFGEWIAFLNKNNVWLIRPDGDGLTQVTSNPMSSSASDQARIGQIKWSPDGRTLAYSQTTADGTGIFGVRVENLTTELLVANIGNGFDWPVMGNEIIFSFPPSGDNPWGDGGLWSLDLESGNTRQIVAPTAENPGFWLPQASPTGGQIIFTIPGFEPAGYGLIDSASGFAVDLPVLPLGGIGMGTCEWEPKGSTIACTTITRDFPHRPVVHLVDVKGNILESIVLPEIMHNISAYWSPDGERLALGYSNEGATWTSILRLDTRQISPLAPGRASTWSPDGVWLVTVGWLSTDSMMMVNTETGQYFSISEGYAPLWQP